jgi:hypothetical protein
MSHEQSGLLELRENTIDRGEARVGAFLEQGLVNVLGREMAHGAFFEYFENAQPRQRRFEADGLQVRRRAQRETVPVRRRRVSYHISNQPRWKCVWPKLMLS